LRNTYLTSVTGLAAKRTVALEDEISEGGDGVYAEAVVDRQTPEMSLLLLSDRAALESAMEKLPAPLLEVILLCDVEEMKYKEIATILEIPMGTVMSRIARGRAALRGLLMAERPQMGVRG
jgi:RNA polymerase sigma-70 factor (ECF subfamily)